MREPVDVDKMVSSFLSELNALCDSLGLIPDKEVAANGASAADSPDLGRPRNPDGPSLTTEDASARPGTPEESRTENATCGDAMPPAASKRVPRRNIDILLMSDNRFTAGMMRNTEESSSTSKALQDHCFTGTSYRGQPRPARMQLRWSSCWVPVTTRIRKFQRWVSRLSGIYRVRVRLP